MADIGVVIWAPIVVLIVAVGVFFGYGIFYAYEYGASEPYSHNNARALTAAAHGAPLPDRYVPMRAEITAVEHHIARTPGADSHTVNVSLVSTGRNNMPVDVWVITDESSLMVNCVDGQTRLSTTVVITLGGCFDLAPGHEPLAVVLIARIAYGNDDGLFDLPVRQAVPLPLFGAPVPPGLECETTDDRVLCVSASG